MIRASVIGTARQDRARRERRRPDDRQAVEELLRWATYLPRGDRALLEAVLRDGQPLRLLAEMTGGPPATLSHRLRGVLERVRSREFQLVALRGRQLDPADRRIAELLFLHGRSGREVARRTGHPPHRVRRLRDAIRQMVVLLHADA